MATSGVVLSEHGHSLKVEGAHSSHESLLHVLLVHVPLSLQLLNLLLCILQRSLGLERGEGEGGGVGERGREKREITFWLELEFKGHTCNKLWDSFSSLFNTRLQPPSCYTSSKQQLEGNLIR